ncbi:hypothetical protein T265_01399 [Opisthorchis viverrini]|uniref:Uncharacterized protein n=1 Tax=Opisthorchis viverrini TaxID=6198 RepID=A0A075A2P5_OPIVI|nr:hypothetical protein T265_01399 [Opisthorchis viverrini]KER32522.1 hypothetical protein T265_01399 [Opisthorchis viverrini]
MNLIFIEAVQHHRDISQLAVHIEERYRNHPDMYSTSQVTCLRSFSTQTHIKIGVVAGVNLRP